MTRRNFTAEFKNEAAKLVVDDGYSQTKACAAMGVGASAMRRWVKQLRQERGGETPQAAALTPEQQRIQALEARVRELEKERAVLKKATAFFVKELDQPTR
jgi:transposase